MTESFLGVTAHFMDSRKERNSIALANRTFPQPHTTDRVRQLLETILAEWEIPTVSVLLVVTDNGSNMVAAFRESYQQMLEDEEEDAITDVNEQLNENEYSPLAECRCLAPFVNPL